MKFLDIRDRVLLAALLPVTLVAVLLSVVFLIGRVDDYDEAHSQRARALARQVASASEYGLFSSNISSLHAIAAGALREVDVRSVRILDAQGQAIARAGQAGYGLLPALGSQEGQWNDAATGNDLWVQPVMTSQVQVDDLFESAAGTAAGGEAQILGHVVVEMSRQALVSREQDMLLAGFAVALGGLFFGAFLAVRIGRGVIRPILEVSDMIERIGRGELSVRAAIKPDDPLRDLQRGLNQMAQRLERGRDELEQRVAQATSELREKKEEAETATLAKSRFLAAASHDLRQPTHALGMFVARLAQLSHDGETRHLIVNLEASVRAMQDLLDALLDISRLESQTVKAVPRPFPVAELLDQLRAGLTHEALGKGLRLRVRPSKLWVMSDPVLLHRILLNLVNNALRYTLRGSILLACRKCRGGSHVRIEVWDSGIGIAPEHQRDIFKEFFQIGNAERDRSKGLGLGLNIVERTARLLGHSLRVHSRLGHGTRFSIELPLAAPGAQATSSELQEVLPTDDLAGLAVLVIEDDELASRALAGLLASWGCKVTGVDGLSAACACLSAGVLPEVIISDYRLHGTEDGLAVISRLRHLAGRPVPACLMSGDTDPELMHRAREAGLVLLHKPVRPAKLRSLVRRLAQEARGVTART